MAKFCSNGHQMEDSWEICPYCQRTGFAGLTNPAASAKTRLEGMPEQVPVRRFTPSGHKIALRAINAGEPVHRYGQTIGFATQPIPVGEHIHTHNLGVQDFGRDYAFGVDVQPVTYVPEHERRTFMGYKRPRPTASKPSLASTRAEATLSTKCAEEKAGSRGLANP